MTSITTKLWNMKDKNSFQIIQLYLALLLTFNEAICTMIPESSKAAYLRATVMIASFYQMYTISATFRLRSQMKIQICTKTKNNRWRAFKKRDFISCGSHSTKHYQFLYLWNIISKNWNQDKKESKYHIFELDFLNTF